MIASRYKIFGGLILCGFVVLGFQLVQLQVLNRAASEAIAAGNAVRAIRVLPARGAIVDRNGAHLVTNVPMYSITLEPRRYDKANTPLLAELLGVSDSVVTAKLRSATRWNAYRPSLAFADIDFSTFSRVMENLFLLPGVSEQISQKRRYVGQSRASHALGYLREVNRAELKILTAENEEAKYRQGDYIGKTGIEREYERQLRGIPGTEKKVINIHGLTVKAYNGGLEDELPALTPTIHLAMDDGVQAMAESLFVNKRGALVALNVHTGGIIAMVSAPDFALSTFTQPMKDSTWRYLTSGRDKPLYNRATMNLMPPGSTWKPFMALLALSEGYVNLEGDDSTVLCRGYHPIGRGRRYRCLGAHGEQNVTEALQNSCNTFFFEMGARMDVTQFKRYAGMFGFGALTPSDIREVTAGLIPDSAYFNRSQPDWTVGTQMNLGIGQGAMGVTPLQLVRYTAAIANGGRLPTPHLVTHWQVAASDSATYQSLASQFKQVDVPQEYLEIVRMGMRNVMERGSGRASQIRGIATGGKTGTAQAPGDMEDHSVFVMFAPYDAPEIAIAVQCENTGQGAYCAAPIASLIVERYLTGQGPAYPDVRWNRALRAVSQEPAN